MLSKEIMQKLVSVTEEEQAILKGNGTIDRSIYMTEDNNVVNSKKMLSLGKLITVRPHTRFIDFPPHTHDFIEVVYMCSGSTVHIINGETVTLNAGELLFLSMDAVQETLSASETDIAVNFMILPQFFDKTLSMLGKEETPLRRFIIDCISRKNHDGGYLHFKVSEVLPVQNLVENLIYTIISDTPNKRQINETTMGLLILQLINNTDKLYVGNKADEMLIEVFRYIEENYVSGSLSALAELLHCDLYWLSREIKQRTGKNFTDLMQEKRLMQAAFLLRTTKINIADISAAVGYENASYFHRLFVKETGMTPREYRIEWRE